MEIEEIVQNHGDRRNCSSELRSENIDFTANITIILGLVDLGLINLSACPLEHLIV